MRGSGRLRSVCGNFRGVCPGAFAPQSGGLGLSTAYIVRGEEETGFETGLIFATEMIRTERWAKLLGRTTIIRSVRI